MTTVAQVNIHPSQFPDSVRRDLLESLRSRRVNHKFHYDSLKQTRKWLALHQAYAPSRTDPDCAATYDRSFNAAVETIPQRRVHLIGLGCGGGQKDARLLQLLRDSGKEAAYTPSDVSNAMVLVARQEACRVIPEAKCFPLVCDLATAEDLPQVLEQLTPPGAPSRLLSFFGMLPNFEAQMILPKLASLVRPGDTLLMSANLAPGADYEAGVRTILPLYDNALTRDWLMTFLTDLGAETGDGELSFKIETDPGGSGLNRIAAWFQFARARELKTEEQSFPFKAGDALRLFFSYRHTPALIATLLGQYGLQVAGQWITRSGEEGVFLVRRT